jgi:acyl-CoA synthetase (AMP-forming)/AMP-acid ligase II
MNGAGISCGELDAESSRLAHGLRALGADCAVTGVADAEAGEVPKAFVVPRTGRQIDLDGLARFVAERLAGYKQVRHFEVVGSIPRTPSGKILRRMLKESNR